jgi:RNA 3'-terminal phosphate cyclase (ATP)
MAMLVLDGSHGEGGGQILRTAVAVAALTGRSIRIEKIRAGRPRPGLAAQHLTAVRAAAAICAGHLKGDALDSRVLELHPSEHVRTGDWKFDVRDARPEGSAGAATLVLHTVVLPLALAAGPSVVTVRGGTHASHAPPFEHVRGAWAPVLRAFGLDVSVDMSRGGWHPVGGGIVSARIAGDGHARPIDMADRGELVRIVGAAVTSRLPDHVAARMAERAKTALSSLGVPIAIDELRPDADGIGAAIGLTAEYTRSRASFSALGRRGKPAEIVAEEAASQLEAHVRCGAAVDEHTADQLLLPAAFSDGTSTFTTERSTRHLHTNAWVLERFGLAETRIEERPDGTALVTIARS